MDNISEARTEVESVTAAPSNNSAAVITSISQEPIFDGDEHQKSYDDNETGELNVSLENVMLRSFGRNFKLWHWFSLISVAGLQ